MFMQYHVTCKSHAVFNALSVTKSNNNITAQHSLEFACNLDDSLHNSGLLPLLHNFWVCSVSGELRLNLHPDDLLLSSDINYDAVPVDALHNQNGILTLIASHMRHMDNEGI